MPATQTFSANHTHARLLGGTRGRSAEIYPGELARAIAVMTAEPEGFEVFPVDDDWGVTKANHETDGAEAIDEVPARDATVRDDEVWTGGGLLERMQKFKSELAENVSST